jgi:hypothetical protein
MRSTGQVCDLLAVYRSACCNQDIAGKAGTVLPICPRCLRDAQWSPVFSTMNGIDAGLAPKRKELADKM